MEKKALYKAVIGYLDHYKELKGTLFRVLLLFTLDGKAVSEFDVTEHCSALLKDTDSAKSGILGDEVSKKGYYEVLVEDINPKKPLTKFVISSSSSFNPAYVLYNSCWIRKNKKENLFISTKGIVKDCQSFDKFFPLDIEESCIYSEIYLGEDNNFIADDGVIRKYKLENLDFLNSACEADKNIYVLSQSGLDSIKKKLVDEIDFIDKAQLKEWFVKASRVDQKVLTEALNSINDDGLEATAFKIRSERCRKLFESFSFSEEDISFFFGRKNLRKELNEYREKQQKQIDKELAAEKQKSLEAIASHRDIEIEKKLADTKRELSDKEDILKTEEGKLTAVQSELASLEKDIEDKKNLLTTLENEVSSMKTTKCMIIEALKEEVRNQQPAVPDKNIDSDRNVDDVLYFESCSAAEEVEPEDCRLLFPKGKFGDQRDELAAILSYKASVIPDISYAYAVAHLLTNTYVKVITVEHGWYHYEDFVKAGILDFYNEALSDENRNYLLVLENINVVPIECSLKPIIDLIDGRRLNLPGSERKCFPKNLRILATVLPSAEEDDFGIKLNERVFEGFHFVETPTSRLSLFLNEIMEIEPRCYVDLKSLKIVDIVGDNGYSRYKDY